MQPARQVIREFRWSEIFPGLLLVRVFRSSVRIHALVLSLIATILIAQGWRICARLTLPPESSVRTALEVGDEESRNLALYSLEASPGVNKEFRLERFYLPLQREFERFSWPVRRFFSPGGGFWDRVFILLGGGWTLVVGGFFAGVLSRTAAFDLTAQPRYGVFRATRFVGKRFGRYCAAPLIPFLLLLGMTIPLFLLALFATHISALLAAVVWGIAIVWSLVTGLIAVSYLFAWPMLWPALSTEDADSFDALGSAFGYVSQRPFTYLVYAIFAAIIARLGLALFSAICLAGSRLLFWCFMSVDGEEVTAQLFGIGDGSPMTATRYIAGLANDLESRLGEAYLFSAFWTSATGIYLLLRYHVDGMELDDVYRDGAEDEKPMPALARQMGLTGETASVTSPVAPPT